MMTGPKTIPTGLLCCLWTVGIILGAGQPAFGGEVEFDHPGGFCDGDFALALAASTEHATIYYTTNGEEPRPDNASRYLHPIAIASTTIVRAAAFDSQTNPAGCGARTFLFASDVLNQTGAHFPQIWGTNGGKAVLAEYGMSTGGEKDAGLREKVMAGLRSLDTCCIIADPADLFSAETGIYAHPLERGGAWERRVSLEMFEAGGRSAFRCDCGLRIHGGTSRQPKETPKHSFRLVFKKRYGPARFHFPVFGPVCAQDFGDLILRAGNNDSWSAGRGEGRRQVTYLRDEWMRRTMLDLHQPSARGCFVHLYLNGLYWGVYNLCERPGSDLLGSTSTDPAGFDVRKGGQTVAGDALAWDGMMALANRGLSDEGSYEEIGRRLDIGEFADYMILNLYAGNSDWDRSANWYAIRPRTAAGRFQFLVWDGECTLGQLNADTQDLDDDESPQRLFHKLSENSAFRRLFAAGAKQLLFNAGALAPEKNAARFQGLANAIAAAMWAEAARWGNHDPARQSGHVDLYGASIADQLWQPEVRRLLEQYFPQRRAFVLNQFRERGLYQEATGRP